MSVSGAYIVTHAAGRVASTKLECDARPRGHRRNGRFWHIASFCCDASEPWLNDG